ncbi:MULTISPECIES: MFS transporter [Saccharibacillus]|uniref:MFS transporter n=1 Tax=Saccharibacillus TaxID=456492 RepID=UPI00123C0F19|nr:MFS transporter [Saccharibacillus sp. WB 17]MWJ32617.1 MFS transporter [Saccharibacillus sp. WB 17]
MKSLIGPGMAMVAVCYAFARFAFALFLPDISREFELDAAAAGRMQSLSYLAYVLALIVSTATLRVIGQRGTILVTGACAIAGLTLIAAASDARMLSIGLFAAGLSTGWVSPVLGQLVARSLEPQRQNGANARINSGSGIGIVLSGLAAMIFAASWRGAYALFALVGVLTVAWLIFRLRGVPNERPRGGSLWSEARKSGRLLPASLIAGLGCAAYWTYLISHLQAEQHLSAQTAAGYWIAVGAAGIAGGSAGKIAAARGLRRVYRLGVALLSVSVALIPLSVPAISLLSALLFGAAYVLLTSLFILWGTGIPDASPSAQISLSFLALGVGQFAGSWLAGIWIEAVGYNAVFLLFALVLLIGLLFYPNAEKPALPKEPAA